MTPRLLFDHPRADLGESPRWDAQAQAWRWVDITAHTVHTGTQDGQVATAHHDQPVTCLAPTRGGGWVGGGRDGAVRLLADGALEPLGEAVLAARPDYRANDGRAGPDGALWWGSVDTAKTSFDAALYRTAGGHTQRIEGGMATVNGIAFDGTGRMALADTPRHRLRFVRPGAGGTIAETLVDHRFPEGVGPTLGRPDGGSFDVEGAYWTAMFDGWRVVRLGRDGTLLAEVPLLVQRPTMIAFGGPDGRDAVVTTARVGLSERELSAQPLAGAVFTFRVDVPGVAEFAYDG